MGRSSREESLRTRAALLDAARGLFLERGFDAVSVEDVGRAVGVTRGAVYHHFGGKRPLFEEVVAGLHREIAVQVGRAAEAAGPGRPGLVAGCLAFLDAAGAPAVRRTLLLEAPAVLGWRHWRSLDADHSRALLERGLRALEEAGELAAGSATAAATLLSGAMNEAVLWLAEEEAEPEGEEGAGESGGGARARIDETLRRILESLVGPADV
ncbi:TetR/AcrR family transcriptional regulator [Nocardioides pantholopis]|uniref:TetR/AcrR family transcriptional regulator n=1 Tax=Nocardioides pantholopis TaxID=2483798 RepID=UPI0013E3FF83|nr:TetR/AcrR family transcriptional regulator [Nocardioides pantholopis]